MKIIPLKYLLLNNAPLKIISLVLGYSFWHIATINQIITTTVTIPLCFNLAENYTINAPEKINITLKGKRSDLYTIDISSLAAHIDATKLSLGKHGILINEHNLFLPQTISVVCYKPSNIIITITKT